MKKMSLAALSAALCLAAACSPDVASEMRASSPSAAEFNRQTANSTKSPEEIAADSVAEARRLRRSLSEDEAR